MDNNESRFTDEEIRILKKLVRDELFRESFVSDFPYKNRFEDYDDTYEILRQLGFSHEAALEHLGKKLK